MCVLVLAFILISTNTHFKVIVSVHIPTGLDIIDTNPTSQYPQGLPTDLALPLFY